MQLKRTFIISSVLHGVIFAFLSSGIDWSWHPPKASIPLETHLVFKNKHKNKELLPRKSQETPPPPPEALKESVEKPKTIPTDKAALKKIEPAGTLKKETTKKYTADLASLSQKFAHELATQDIKKTVEPAYESNDDSSYFDQVYTLIKESFVVPPHLDGPKGKTLQAVVRIYLATDGTLNKIDLETSSGDEQFDKAVVDGTRRVNNFGAVPIFLQDVLQKRGIVVELCPVKCKEP